MFSFPNPINEKAVRLVAGAVALIAALALVTGWHWLLILLACGFVARAILGPRFSPLARLAGDVLAPRLGDPKPVPGPPKRFAQAIGATLTVAGSLLAFGFGIDAAAVVVLAIMVTFATLESVFGLCVGCRIFNVLMRVGVIPEEVCEDCLDISRRYA